MKREQLYNELLSLPPEGLQQVTDLILFLKSQYEQSRTTEQTDPDSIRNDPFIGIWKERESMKDSSQWVREIRKSEWST